MPIGSAPMLLAREDVVVAPPSLGGRPHPAELGRAEALADGGVRADGLVVGEHGTVADVFGFEQVEDERIVGVGRAREVQVCVARVGAEHRSIDSALDRHGDAPGFAGGDPCAQARGRYSRPFATSTRTFPAGTMTTALPVVVEEPPEVTPPVPCPGDCRAPSWARCR